SGTPIRQELLSGSKSAALSFLDFSEEKPIVLIMGGSLGSVFINNAVREALDTLLSSFQIIHLCGNGNLDPALENKAGYRQFEYISDELSDLFAAADLVVSRAGANAISELLVLRKPNILIPLSKNASRGDQILNANSFAKQGFSVCIEEEDVSSDSLPSAIFDVYERRDEYKKAMEQSPMADSIGIITNLLKELAGFSQSS
ncbi:MAG: UDP-N-acetylglucosamine--N-acetylmuramyl-(pentapeptide) pyrophosphoryl-undecaprenol N-acetylglucosamine transferase, partial [Lachnospiraceae bacterium]|nr:UDP-N-acetylglucosamine--N-acetylmuramyl-(pentapeptide) pyrophosphoryl-undecaprenol N-acetylglucosamine transferase [Lachnospiraceae bacterium]